MTFIFPYLKKRLRYALETFQRAPMNKKKDDLDFSKGGQ